MALGIRNARKRLLGGLLPALKFLPPAKAARIVEGLGAWECRLNPGLRVRFESAVGRADAYFRAGWDVPKVARGLAGRHLRWHARDRFLDGLSDFQADAVIPVEGLDELESALGLGKGVVLLFNHFGPFLMPAHWLVRNNYPLRWFTERPRHISKLVARTFETDGPLGQRELFISRKLGPTEGGSAIRKAVRMLQAGLIVQLAGDVRWSGARCAPGRFLGHDHNFTTTWINLAARTGAPVVPACSIMLADGSNPVRFGPAFEVPRSASADPVAAARLVQGNLDAVERLIAEHPENSLDYFFWEAPVAPSAAGLAG